MRKRRIALGISAASLLALIALLASPTRFYQALVLAGPESVKPWCFERVRSRGPEAVPVIEALLSLETYEFELEPGTEYDMSGPQFRLRSGNLELLEWIESRGPAAADAAPALLRAAARAFEAWRRFAKYPSDQLSAETVETWLEELEQLVAFFDALQAIGAERLVPVLEEALDSEEPELALVALTALERIYNFREDRPESALPEALAQRLVALSGRTEDPYVRDRARLLVWGFHSSDLPSAESPFEAALTEGYLTCAFRIAGHWLRAPRPRGFEERLDEFFAFTLDAIEAPFLERRMTAAASALLRDEEVEEDSRAIAAVYLSLAGQETEPSVLIESLRRRGAARALKTRALMALGAHREAEAELAPLLIRAVGTRGDGLDPEQPETFDEDPFGVVVVFDEGEYAPPVLASEALTSLAALGEKTAPFLAAALEDEDELARRGAAIALASLELPSELKSSGLRRLLEDRDPRVRLAAVEVLAPSMSLSPTLLEGVFRALDDSDSKLRQAAIVSLARLFESHPEVLPGLLERLDPSEESRLIRVLRCLSEIGPCARPAAPKLRELLVRVKKEPIPRPRLILELRLALAFIDEPLEGFGPAFMAELERMAPKDHPLTERVAQVLARPDSGLGVAAVRELTRLESRCWKLPSGQAIADLKDGILIVLGNEQYAQLDEED